MFQKMRDAFHCRNGVRSVHHELPRVLNRVPFLLVLDGMVEVGYGKYSLTFATMPRDNGYYVAVKGL